MKKLIAIAALAACLPAFSGQVASSNTVGYQKVALGTEFNWVAPQFLNIGGQGINIQAIQLKFADGYEAMGGDNLQILDEGGATLNTYGWALADWYGGTTDGWLDMDTGALADISIPAGQSVLINVEQEGTSVIVSGEVGTEDYVTTGVEGFNFVGNTTPSPINVQDIELDFGEGEAMGGDNLQLLDEGGATLNTYGWALADWYGGSVDGWLDMDTGALADFVLNPGQGVLVNIETQGTTIKVPPAL